jgi:hypothetical protein
MKVQTDVHQNLFGHYSRIPSKKGGYIRIPRCHGLLELRLDVKI